MTHTPGGRPVSMPMALNGSNFGASSALDLSYEKEQSPDSSPPLPHVQTMGYDYTSYPTSYAHGQHPQQGYDHDDYTSFPPAVQPASGQPTAGIYESDSEGDLVGMANGGHGTTHGGAGNTGVNVPPVYRIV